MSDNPLQNLFRSFEKLSNCIQTHVSNFTAEPHHPSPTTKMPLFSVSSSSKVNPAYNDTYIVQPKDTLIKGKSAAPVTKEELGRCTWTFLHTLAAQYPENPTRQQKRDVKELMAILSRMYPCKDCADHFKEVLRLKCTFTTIPYRVTTLGAEANPVQAGSQADFSQWLCHVHNVVNRSLGKLVFPCERVDARWGKLECEQRACDLLGSTTDFGKD